MLFSIRSLRTAAKPLVSTATVNVGKLAGAVAARIRKGESCMVDAAGGPEASFNAVKCLKLASEYIQDSHPRMQVAFELQKVTIAADEDLPDAEAMRFHTILVKQRSMPKRSDIASSKNMDPRKTATDLSKILQDRPTGAAAVSIIGPDAMSMALETVLLANTYLLNDLKEGQALLAVASSHELEKRDGSKKRQWWLNCVRGPKAIAKH